MAFGCEVRAPRHAVNHSLNGDPVRRARERTGNLSERVDMPPADDRLITRAWG
ncbi:hypothetical protein [Azospirillum halopraeferens]|uniref:hypothetical protein n=1 Tax=Azospirillum halopraeferens TaxID=34010 RepID=UPI00040B909D|nr:hypothetical protein [Azospirillum halopraeferens]